ncbi:MAG: 4Fe-4S dicluster domain-containing protein [Candidatus Latescibacterota bacterium]|nr:MAG: 4Fe-4S dicluster domain-containing protein [Candidatus Latescibacterota bacterium]
MGIDRRKFLKVAGVAALGLASGSSKQLLARGSSESTTAGKPAVGKRWAMVIDLKKCQQAENCTKCVDACHKFHNVPEFDNPKDEIKWIWKEPFEHAFHNQEHEYAKEELKHSLALLLCNHCDSPPCVKVCPTQATWKRQNDGIVMMDWHRCIGCRYCVAACPYGSRSFNWRDPRPFIEEMHDDFPTRSRGVVEKCTFCEERLARGQMPACVEACKEKALVFGDLEDPNSEIRKVLGANFTIRRRPELGTKPEVYYLV